MTSLSIGGRNEHCHPWGPRRAIVENIERNPATLLQSRAEGGLLARLSPGVYLYLLSWGRGWTPDGSGDGRSAGQQVPVPL